MSRIIAGALRGRTFEVPAKGTRPTSDRIREAIFAKLDHWGVIEDAHVLDLFAGSGALAFESLSRGAAKAVLVDASKQATQVVRANADHLGIADQTRVVLAKAEKFAAGSSVADWDLVFLDPPYDFGAEALDGVLVSLEGHVTPGAVIVVERDKHAAVPQWPASWEFIEAKDYGSTIVYYAERPV